MAYVKIANAQDGSDARYDRNQATDEERRNLDADGRPLGADLPGQWEWTQGLPGARELNAEGGGGGGGGGGFPGGHLVAQQLAIAKKAYENAIAKITNQRQTLSRNAGYTFDVDPETGVMRSMRVDPQSLYGTFQMLNRQQADRDEAARASAVERGLGAGGGLAAQMRSDARFQSGEEDAKFSSALTDTISQLALQQQDAKNAYDQAKWQAELEQARLAALQAAQSGGGGWGDPGGSPEDVARAAAAAPREEDTRYADTGTMLPKRPYQVNPVRVVPSQPVAPKYSAIQAARANAMARAYGR